ncbi:hypothetical protein [Stx2 converting phage I]|uniref:Uncharacterized protein n=1 Tax=Stx2 converting phage I TaxID=180816 RepID=Q8SC31_9CAUD|nr:hypothetical protein [Stx2 converting phage I]
MPWCGYLPFHPETGRGFQAQKHLRQSAPELPLINHSGISCSSAYSPRAALRRSSLILKYRFVRYVSRPNSRLPSTPIAAH